ncbi:MAG: pilus assembly protein N-terminal domain-containing protein [Pirellulales bacterium]
MYDHYPAPSRSARYSFPITVALAVGLALQAAISLPACAQNVDSGSVVRKISEMSDKMELTTNTSRILTLDKNIPRVQVNNPELLAVTPLSANQVQISAKKAGVTQVNLWDEQGGIHTVDVQIYGDARELSVALQTQFPHSSIKVYRYSESLVLTGYTDRPDHVPSIMRLAEDYAPKVINNITVGGVQQILLKVKVLEISRTKLRRLATDFAFLDANGGFFASGVSGLLTQTSNVAGGGFQTVADTAGKAAEFGIVGDNGAFFGFIDWVQQNNIAKILAEPNIVAVSGRPAQFNVGGEIPIVVPQSLGTASIEYKPFGTQVDFLPIVLGNGNIRLEVRPRISEIDDSRSVIIQNFTIPALTVRQVDTAVEMKAGQTFALAGLVQERSETVKRGLPYVMDMPVIGVPFRKTEDEVNEIELLIIVTPEFVDAMDPGEVPCGGPGMFSTSPTTRGLYCAGQMEVPNHCNPTQGLTSCGQDPCGNPNCNNCGNGGSGGGCNSCGPSGGEHVVLPGGTGYDDGSGPAMMSPGAANRPPALMENSTPNEMPMPSQAGSQNVPPDISLPSVEIEDHSGPPPAPASVPNQQLPPAPLPPTPAPPPAVPATPPQPSAEDSTLMQGGAPSYTAPRPYSPQRQPVFMRNASRPYNPQAPNNPPAPAARQGGLVGPVGYDVQ